MSFSSRRPVRHYIHAAAALAVMALSTSHARAAFPDKPVTLVVPYSAGGGTDAVARTIAKSLSMQWKQPVVVENRGGADGWLGTQHVLAQPADGYTILMQISQIMLWKWTLPNAKFDVIKDVRLVAKLQRSPMVLSVPASSEATSIQDFFARCKVKQCSFGTATVYSQVVGAELFSASGIKNAVNARYKGTSPMMTDLLGAHIDLAFPSSALAVPLSKDGKVRTLAVGSRERYDKLPDTPTLQESGYPVEGDTWYGLMVRSGTPNEAFQAIVEGVKIASRQPDVLEAITAQGGIPVFDTPEAFLADVKRDMVTLEPLAQKYLTEESSKP